MGSWIYTANIIGTSVFMFIGGYIELLLGTITTAMLGGLLYSGGIFFSSFYCHSFMLTFLLYGLIPGIGNGISYGIDIAIAVRWFPNNAGLANGIVLSGYGLGALIFNPIITLLINGDNNQILPGKDFFPIEALRSIHSSIRILGTMYFIIQVIAVILMANPPHYQNKSLFCGDKNDDKHTQQMKDISNGYIQQNTTDVLSITDGNSSDIIEIDKNSDGVDALVPFQTYQFYLIWFVVGINALNVAMITSFWKTLALQNVTKDDYFLSYVGSFISICNSSGRIFWGVFNDKYGFKLSIIVLFGLTTIFTSFIGYMSDKWIFSCVIGIIYYNIGGIYASIPTVVSYTFGHKRLQIIFGFTQTSQILTTITASYLSTLLMNRLGLSGLYLIVSILMFITMIVVMTCYHQITYKEILQKKRKRSF